MEQVLNYNIHDILKFQIVKNKRFNLVRDLNLEHRFFEVDKEGDPDIVLNIGKFTPSNDDCYIIDGKYIKDNYFYCRDSEGKTKWEVEIFGFESGNIIINFDVKVSGIRYLIPILGAENFLLGPLIEYKLSEKGYFLIHSAGISKKDQAYLFAGRGGAFKTSLAMDFIRKGEFNFLGDERVIIHKNEVLSYPWDFIGFNFKCEYLPTENYRGFLDRIRLVNYIRNNYDNQNNLKVNVVDSSILKSLFIVSRKSKQKQTIIKEDVNLGEAINRLIINNQMEMNVLTMPNLRGFASNPYFKYMLAYAFVFPSSHVAKYWNTMKEGLKKILRRASIHEIEMPFVYDVRVFNEIHTHIESEIKKEE